MSGGYKFDRLKVMVVEDNAHMRKLVVTILQAFGCHQITEADSADRAWAMMRDATPDVVVLDWVMEGMSGIDLVKKLRTDPDTPNPFVPIIMLSGHTHLNQVRQARDAGVSEFIAKPVSVKTMMQRLMAVIEHPRPFVRTKSYFGPCRRRRRPDEEYTGPERRTATTSTIGPAEAAE